MDSRFLMDNNMSSRRLLYIVFPPHPFVPFQYLPIYRPRRVAVRQRIMSAPGPVVVDIVGGGELLPLIVLVEVNPLTVDCCEDGDDIEHGRACLRASRIQEVRIKTGVVADNLGRLAKDILDLRNRILAPTLIRQHLR